MSYDRQCSSCGGFCGRGGCKRENVRMSKQREALEMALEALEKYGTPRLNNEDAYSAAIKTIREALAEPEQEPVAWLDPWTQRSVTRDFDTYGIYGIPLYTTPPARKPLTDREIEKCMKEAYATVQGRQLEHAFARAIERAHGIGN